MGSRAMQRWAWTACALACATAVPTAAQAALVYQRDTTVYVAANDGRHTRTLAPGVHPLISPNGRTVAFEQFIDTATLAHSRQLLQSHARRLVAAPANGGDPTVLVDQLGGFSLPDGAWSPDSRKLAVIINHYPSPGWRLNLIDVQTGAVHELAAGVVADGEVSFSPDGRFIAYTKRHGSRTDIYKVRLTDARRKRLVRGGYRPVWGPHVIAFARQTANPGPPKTQIYTIKPNGRSRRQLTHVSLRRLDIGPEPVQFSADGTRLLAQFFWRHTTRGVDISTVATVNPRTGRLRRPQQDSLDPYPEGYPLRLARNGRWILATDSDYLVAIPYNLKTSFTLAPDAFTADWNR